MFGKNSEIPSIVVAGCVLASTISTATATYSTSSRYGEGLIQRLASEYQPVDHFSYSSARDLMYTSLDNVDGVIKGIYTDFEAYVDPSSTSSRAEAYAQGINAEHVWPQSKGATGSAKGDLHNLYSSKVEVNSARGSSPFGEIDNKLTERWFLDDEERDSPPSLWVIRKYSESVSDMFEPREDRKGDVARSVFYFHTMYRDQDDFDHEFFDIQRSTLCKWHWMDKPSRAEIERTKKIGESQQGNVNPYVVDKYLALRAYCCGRLCELASPSPSPSPVQASASPSPVATATSPSPSPAPETSSTTDEALIKQLAEEYKPKDYYTYNTARDFIYSSLDNVDGVLRGVYTNFPVNVAQDSLTPRADAYAQDINAEHVWPQSRGATGYAKGDVHHLFPSKVGVNAARGNNPFGEIDDETTTKWFLGSEQLASIPSSDIDEYSEYVSDMFEPREDRKGDVARAVFYFYTMYNEQEDFDRSFFNVQQKTMCDWHAQDPPSEVEKARNVNIAASLQGNENPYISNPELAVKAFCL
eukprot:CFRG0645T1